jgi:hypothetical protein
MSRETWSDHRALTIAGFAKRKAAGLHCGGIVQYGYRLDEDGRLVVDEHEQAIIRSAKAMRAAGLSLRKIGAALAEQGLTPRTAGQWSAPTIARMVEP